MDYGRFFQSVTGHVPFPYQRRLGEEPWPGFLSVPTGMGKTASVVGAWLWKRLNGDEQTPARLLYCLPMRVLVEQTRDCVTRWIVNAAPRFEERGLRVPSVDVLMGGEATTTWAERPEEPAIVIGTQDMLLSRALMRGYGMSRYQWPVHFAFFHNDVLWVFDEVQLMGAALPTSAQLDAFRRLHPLARPARSLWISATLNPEWFATVDLQPYLGSLGHLELGEDERASPGVRMRCEAVKRLRKAATGLGVESLKKDGARAYAASLAAEAAQRHVPGTTTLVIVNTVERCQAVLSALDRLGIAAETFLVHSRFRPGDRGVLNRKLADVPDPDGPGRIVVATQAVEAGVDMTSRVLFTELAPWPSLAQRWGRNHRYGEAGETGADVFWIDMERDEKLAAPYDEASIESARAKLDGLESASPVDLPPIDEDAPVHPVIRAKDLRDLFNTEPDLTGLDVDVSPYIRDSETPDIQVFWRDLAGGIEEQPAPERTELCRASIAQVKALKDRARKQGLVPYRWDFLDGRWRPAPDYPRPGHVLMLDARAGGYDPRFGFDASIKDPVALVAVTSPARESEAYGADDFSRTAREVTLTDHLDHVARSARAICEALRAEPDECALVCRAAAWHDVGKSHPVFQATMRGASENPGANGAPLLAKSSSKGVHERPRFRHELASMLAWLTHHGHREDADLVAYLIAAHHGKVRLSLRSVPEEREPTPPFGPRFARGIWEDETLPPVDGVDGEAIPSTRLRLDLMELGHGPMGPSWTARTQRLLDRLGPFHLAWFEALVRIADWRASAAEQEEHS